MDSGINNQLDEVDLYPRVRDDKQKHGALGNLSEVTDLLRNRAGHRARAVSLQRVLLR